MSRDIDPLDFQPALIGLQNRAPPPLGRAVLWTVLALIGLLLTWAMLAKLDIVAVAQGRLVPTTYVKIVQPAEQGVIREILVREGQRVSGGSALIRMDAAYSQADLKALGATLELQQINVRRIDAELSGKPFERQGQHAAYFEAALAQYTANQGRSLKTAIAEQRRGHRYPIGPASIRLPLRKCGQSSCRFFRTFGTRKPRSCAYPRLATSPRSSSAKSNPSGSSASRICAARSTSSSFRSLDDRAVGATRRADSGRLRETAARRAAQRCGRDRARHAGTGQGRGTPEATWNYARPRPAPSKTSRRIRRAPWSRLARCSSTLVPEHEQLKAEVWVRNEDVGFVHIDLPTKLKLSTFLFQKYGMLTGKVVHVEADAEDPQQESGSTAPESGAPVYRALIALESQALRADGKQYASGPACMSPQRSSWERER